MKTKLLFLLLTASISAFGQESFKKKYKICRDKIIMQGGDTVYLKKDTLINYLDIAGKKPVEFQLGKKYMVSNEVSLNGKKTVVSNEIAVDEHYLKTLKLEQEKKVTLKKTICAYASFENDKVYINPYLKKELSGKYKNEGIYYFQLKNRQSIKLSFSEFNVSALTLPIKYRFRGKNGLEEDFSTAVNGNIFFGYSLGKTSFFHQEKVGNKTNTWKFSGGLLLGASTVTLNSANTSMAINPVEEDKEIIKGLGSIGVGLTYSFNKINFGAFYGYDYAIGESASRWNYNKKPWLGIAVGYSILSL